MIIIMKMKKITAFTNTSKQGDFRTKKVDNIKYLFRNEKTRFSCQILQKHMKEKPYSPPQFTDWLHFRIQIFTEKTCYKWKERKRTRLHFFSSLLFIIENFSRQCVILIWTPNEDFFFFVKNNTKQKRKSYDNSWVFYSISTYLMHHFDKAPLIEALKISFHW